MSKCLNDLGFSNSKPYFSAISVFPYFIAQLLYITLFCGTPTLNYPRFPQNPFGKDRQYHVAIERDVKGTSSYRLFFSFPHVFFCKRSRILVPLTPECVATLPCRFVIRNDQRLMENVHIGPNENLFSMLPDYMLNGKLL